MIRKLHWNFYYRFCILLSISISYTSELYSQLLSTDELDTCKIYYSLSEALKSPEKVYALNLSKKKLKKFPSAIINLKNLQKLDLYKNKLDTIPDNIQNLTALQYLNIGKNKLTTFPNGITKLKNLKSLILNQN